MTLLTRVKGEALIPRLGRGRGGRGEEWPFCQDWGQNRGRIALPTRVSRGGGTRMGVKSKLIKHFRPMYT